MEKRESSSFKNVESRSNGKLVKRTESKLNAQKARIAHSFAKIQIADLNSKYQNTLTRFLESCTSSLATTSSSIRPTAFLYKNKKWR